jgi:eukaryotic-like serine/threonine-protein kinase
MEPGYVLDDRYEITDLIGKGGHGKVYRANDRHLGCPVAIKVLYGDVAAEREFRIRMEREARAMGQLSGTSAVQIMAFNKTAWGALYIVMEHLEGSDLSAHLARLGEAKQSMPLDELRIVLEPIAHTLQAAHERGIIHRDIKGANVFVMKSRDRGPSRLLDFGLAKDISLDPLTRTGMIAGSPAYISPESWRGKPRPIDHRVDVYGFGVLIFRVLAGRLPFDASQPLDELLIQVTRGERPSLHAFRPDLDASIDAWVRQTLAIDRDQRFHGVKAMWDALMTVLSP